MDKGWTKDGQNHIFIVFGQGAFLTFLGVKKLVLKNSKHRLMGPFLKKWILGRGVPSPFQKFIPGDWGTQPQSRICQKDIFWRCLLVKISAKSGSASGMNADLYDI